MTQLSLNGSNETVRQLIECHEANEYIERKVLTSIEPRNETVNYV